MVAGTSSLPIDATFEAFRSVSQTPRKGRHWHGREFAISYTPSATCTSQTRDEVPDGAFFLFVSKGFSEAIRLSETDVSAEIGL